jgi:hypothetical protein
MAPLVTSGEADSGDFAKLYDRVATAQKRPQRYATQVRCLAALRLLGDLESPNVDEARRSIGMTEPEWKRKPGSGSTSLAERTAATRSR